MKKEELFNIIGEVDGQKVAAAGMAMTKKKSRPVWVKWGAVAACLSLVVTLLPLINNMINTETPNNPNPGAIAAHVYLDGKGYFYNGKLTYELPEGYEYVGDIINVGDTPSGSRKDFEGNVDGKIYMNQAVADTAYFSWAEWNEEVDGPAPFLKLELKKNQVNSSLIKECDYMKKKIVVIITVIIALVASFLIGTGFSKRTDVVLVEYSVSEDGTEITLNTAIPTSMGYIRGFENKGGGAKPHYLTFYRTFGGLNSSFGAKHAFELALDKTDTEIWFNRADGGYELVLKKNVDTGEWERPTPRKDFYSSR